MDTMTLNVSTINADDILDYTQQLIDETVEAGQQGKAAHKVESKLFKQLLKMGLQFLTLYFHSSGTGDVGNKVTIEENNGELIRFPEPATKRYQSVFGEISIPRRVYGKRVGQKMEYLPLDAKLQLPTGHMSYVLQEWSQTLATQMPYGNVDDILQMILNQSLSTHTLNRNNHALSQSVTDYHKEYPPSPLVKEKEIVVTSADGKGVPMRCGCKKMSLVASVYTIAPHKRSVEDIVQALFDKTPLPLHPVKRPAPIAKQVRATLKRDEEGTMQPSMESMFGWLNTEVTQRDPNDTHPHVLIMDGQKSLWEEAAKQATTYSVEILDLLHATGYVWKAAEQFHDTKEGKKTFARFYTTLLLQGQVQLVIDSLRVFSCDCNLKTQALKEVEKVCGYFHNNRKRMDYDEYLKAGYPIASGVIEGACRYVVKDRMERSGMRWQMRGAQAMLDLRCITLNDDWNDYMPFHIQQENKRLYGNIAENDDNFEIKIRA